MVDDDPIGAWRSLLLAHAAAVQAIESDLAQKEAIPLSWYDVLLELNSAEHRRLRMSDLGERAVLSRSRVSRIVDELERAKLVRRERDPTDGRSTLAVLTEDGRVELRRAAPHYLAGISRHFLDLLSDRERRTISRALGRVAAHHHEAAPRR